MGKWNWKRRPLQIKLDHKYKCIGKHSSHRVRYNSWFQTSTEGLGMDGVGNHWSGNLWLLWWCQRDPSHLGFGAAFCFGPGVMGSELKFVSALLPSQWILMSDFKWGYRSQCSSSQGIFSPVTLESQTPRFVPALAPCGCCTTQYIGLLSCFSLKDIYLFLSWQS
jgi:hypothetical protein